LRKKSIDFKARQHTGQKLKAKRKPMIYNILSGKGRLGNTKKQKQSKTKIKNKNKKKRSTLPIPLIMAIEIKMIKIQI
jgi:hypothetical protein